VGLLSLHWILISIILRTLFVSIANHPDSSDVTNSSGKTSNARPAVNNQVSENYE